MEGGQRLWDAGVFFSTAQAIRAIQADSITPSDFLDSIVGWRSAEGERDVHGGDDGAGPRSTRLCVQPVVLRGGCAELAKRWTHDHLRQSVQQGLEVDVDRAPHRSRGLFADTKDQRESLGIEELTIPFEHMLDPINCLRSDSDYYLQQQSWPFDTVFPVLSREHRTLACDVVVEMATSATAKIMWFGTGPTRSQLHFDRKNNLVSQICGTKEFVLFAPDQTPNLYQYTDESGTHFRDRFSMIDLNSSVAVAEERYPLAKTAAAASVVLHPGDVMYLPKNWWHIVVSTPDPVRHANIMISMFFSKGDVDSQVKSGKPSTTASAIVCAPAVITPTPPKSTDGGMLPPCSVVVDGVEVDAAEEDLAAAFAFDEDSD